MANITHCIKLGNIVCEIVAPTSEGYHCRAFNQDIRVIMRDSRNATVVERNPANGRMRSCQVKL